MRSLQCVWALFGLLFLSSNLTAQWNAELLKDFSWREVGPTATGGRITDIEVRPGRHSEIFVASASGGLWHTINNGTTWQCLFEYEETLSLGDIALDPQQPQVIWVGTGEANNQRSSYWGDGIYKSIDGGQSWRNMGLAESHHIGRIVVDPSDSDTVYVAALGHLYTSNAERGLYRTKDGGESWQQILDLGEAVGVSEVVIDPHNSKILYAAGYERLRRPWHFDGAGPGSGIYRSADGGDSWQRISAGLPKGEIGRIGIEASVKTPGLVLACLSNQNIKISDSKASTDGCEVAGFRVDSMGEGPEVVMLKEGGAAARQGFELGDRILTIAGESLRGDRSIWQAILERIRPGDSVRFEYQRGEQKRSLRLQIPLANTEQIGGEIYRSEDYGVSWSKINEEAVGGNPAYYYGQIRIDPQDDQRVYVLGIPLYYSDDGGVTWQSDGASTVHVDHHAMWINPTNSDHLLLGNDGGFHSSYDRAKTWDHVYNLPLAQFYAIGVDMQQPYMVYGGLQDNGTFGGPSQARRRGGTGRFEWRQVGGGDGFYAQIDPHDSNIIFTEWQFGGLMRQNLKSGERKFIRPPQSDAQDAPDRYNWNSPIMMSEHNSRTIYFGGNKLFKTYNRGDDWQVISPDLSTADPKKIAGNVPHCTITTIAESALDKKVLLVGTDDGNIQWSVDAGANWARVSDNLPLKLASWWVTRVELSHHDVDTAYVTMNAFREDDFRPFVFMTTDRGQSWTSIAAGLPIHGPLNVIKEDRINPNLLYVGTDFSVWFSPNRGQQWLELNKDLPRVAVHDLLVHPRDQELVIGTHGRGIYITDARPLQELTEENLSKSSHLFEVADVIRWARIAVPWISGDRKRLAPNGARGAVIYYYLKEASEDQSIKLEVFNAAGEVVKSFKTKSTVGIHRFVWAPRTRRATVLGDYTVRLSIGDTVQSQSFEVLPDPVSLLGIK